MFHMYLLSHSPFEKLQKLTKWSAVYGVLLRSVFEELAPELPSLMQFADDVK